MLLKHTRDVKQFFLTLPELPESCVNYGKLGLLSPPKPNTKGWPVLACVGHRS